MPYATDDFISQTPIEGGIEITEADYAAALDGMLLGKLVSIVDGVLVVAFPPSPEPEPEPEPPTNYVLFKSTFIRRMSEEEAAIMEMILAAPETPAKLRLLFNSVEYFVSDDPLFDNLMAAVAAALGADRAQRYRPRGLAGGRCAGTESARNAR